MTSSKRRWMLWLVLPAALMNAGYAGYNSAFWRWSSSGPSASGFATMWSVLFSFSLLGIVGVVALIVKDPERRWFRFSLKILLLAMAVCAATGYGVVEELLVRLGRQAFERDSIAWEQESLSTATLCESSLRLLHAELRVPFANKARATEAHRRRIATIRQKAYPILEQGMGGELDKREQKAEIDAYYTDAERFTQE